MNKSVNKVFLIGRLTRNPELRHTTTNKAVCAFGWQPTEPGKQRLGKNRKKPIFTGLWRGTNWLSFAIRTFGKAEWCMWKADCKIEPTPGKTALKSTPQKSLRKK